MNMKKKKSRILRKKLEAHLEMEKMATKVSNKALETLETLNIIEGAVRKVLAETEPKDNKLNKLENLNKVLKSSRELSGVFLPSNLRKQFDFMFVAEMPSENKPKNWDGKSNYNFNVTKRDEFFQKMIKDNGLGGSYATDIVKEINTPRKPSQEEIEKHQHFLLKEIEIIKPKNIIVVGKRTYEGSFKRFIGPFISKDIKVDWIYHYSQQGAKTKTEIEQKFREVVNKMKK